MDALNYVVEFTIKPGQLSEFKKMADWFIERANEDEPGTRTYQWFLTDDESKGYLHEGFDNAAGLVAHAGGPNVQGRIGDLLATADITRFEVYGDPDDAAKVVLDGFGAVVHGHYGGFTR